MPRTHRLDAQRAVFCHALGRAEPRGHSAPEQWTARLPALSDAVDTPLRGFLAPLRSVPFLWLKAGNRKSFGIRKRPPGRRPRSGGRVLNGPARRNRAGARCPSIVALFAGLSAGGASGAPCRARCFAGLRAALNRAATPPQRNGQPCGLAASRFERCRGHAAAGVLAPLRSVPFLWLKAGNRKSSGIRSGLLDEGRAQVVGS